MPIWVAVGLALCPACGPGSADADGSGSGDESGSSEQDDDGPSDASGSSGGTNGSSTGGMSGPADTSAESTGASGTTGAPDCEPVEGAPGIGEYCSMQTQDCDCGLKCRAWGTIDPYEEFAYCTPIYANPKTPGEACSSWEAGGLRVDDCDATSECVLPGTITDPADDPGVCVPFCAPFSGECDPDRYCHGSQAHALCYDRCDPVLANCISGTRCAMSSVGPGDFICFSEAINAREYGEPCWTGVCESGTVCLDGPDVTAPGAVPGCSAADGHCCTTYCDINSPTNDCPDAAQGQTCYRFAEPMWLPPDRQHVGVCSAVPP